MDTSEIFDALITRPVSLTEPSALGAEELKTSLGGETPSEICILGAVRLG